MLSLFELIEVVCVALFPSTSHQDDDDDEDELPLPPERMPLPSALRSPDHSSDHKPVKRVRVVTGKESPSYVRNSDPTYEL